MSKSKLESTEFLRNVKLSVDKSLESADEVVLKLDVEAIAYVRRYLHQEGYTAKKRVEIDFATPLPPKPFAYSLIVKRL